MSESTVAAAQRALDEAEAERKKDTRSDAQLRRDIADTRNELARTLDAVEYKFDVPARGREMAERSKRGILRMWDENPLLVIGAAAGTVVVVAGAVVAATLLTRRDSAE